ELCQSKPPSHYSTPIKCLGRIQPGQIPPSGFAKLASSKPWTQERRAKFAASNYDGDLTSCGPSLRTSTAQSAFMNPDFPDTLQARRHSAACFDTFWGKSISRMNWLLVVYERLSRVAGFWGKFSSTQTYGWLAAHSLWVHIRFAFEDAR